MLKEDFNLKVYINKEQSKLLNLLFSYYKLGCRSFEHNSFSHCFNLKDFRCETSSLVIDTASMYDGGKRVG